MFAQLVRGKITDLWKNPLVIKRAQSPDYHRKNDNHAYYQPDYFVDFSVHPVEIGYFD